MVLKNMSLVGLWEATLADVKVPTQSVNMEGDHKLLVGNFNSLRRVGKLKEELTRIKN